MGVTVKEKVKGSGVWWVFVYHECKFTSKKVGSKKLTEQVAEKLRARLIVGDQGMFKNQEVGPTVPLFRDYAKHWLENYIKPLRRDSTYERYAGILKQYLIPELGRKPLDKINRGEIRDLLLKLYKKDLSRSSICSFRNVLSGIMGYAEDEELIKSNPVKGILKKMNFSKDKQGKVEPFTRDEVNLILDTCLRAMPEHYPLFLIAFRTGMRLGEVLGLQWDDIDLENKCIRVSRSYKDRRMTETKTGKVRLVDMSNVLVKTLYRLLRKRSPFQPTTGEGTIKTYLFKRGAEPLAQNTVRGIWKRLLKKAGIRYRKFHEIRHTYASLLLSNGESPVYVKEQLGHSSIQITVDIYGHWIPSSNRDAVNGLDK